MSACKKCGVHLLHCTCWTNSVQISESSVVSAAASADRESTEAGMGMPGTLSGGLGVSLPAAPSTPRYRLLRHMGSVRKSSDYGDLIAYPELGDWVDVLADAILAEYVIAPKAEFDRWLAEVKAEAWDEGRESIALDFLGPLREDGTREPTPNPYRTP